MKFHLLGTGTECRKCIEIQVYWNLQSSINVLVYTDENQAIKEITKITTYFGQCKWENISCQDNKQREDRALEKLKVLLLKI